MARSDTSQASAPKTPTVTRDMTRNFDIRVVPIKVLYTINQATHYCLARHMPVAVKIVAPSKQTGKASRDPKRDSRDSKQASSSSHVTRNQSSGNGTSGRSTNIEWTNIDPVLRELDKSQPSSEEAEEEPEQLYGHVALKSCANAIWAASPELAFDRTRDWSVYALDPLEEVPMPTHTVSSSSSEPTQRGVMTGMGLISHAFAEADGINNPLSVTGKIIEDNGNESLEVVLRLQETMVMPQLQLPIPAHPHYAAWASYAQAQAHMAMYRYGQPPKMVPAAPSLGPRTSSAPPPTTSSSKSNSSRKGSVEPSSSRTTKIDRSSCRGPPRSFDPNERYGHAFTNQPLVRSHSQTSHHPYYYPPSQKTQAQASIPSLTSRTVEAVGQEQLTSLLKRLASVEGGEVPDPGSEEGKAFDRLVALLRSSVQGTVPGPSPLPPSSQPSAASDEDNQDSSPDIEELPAPPPPKPAPTTVRKLRLTFNSAAGSSAPHASSSALPESVASSTRIVGKQKAKEEKQKENVQPLKTGVIGNRKPTLTSSTNSKDDSKTPMKSKARVVSGGNGGANGSGRKRRALEAIDTASATQGQMKKRKLNNGSSRPSTSSDDHCSGKVVSRVANTPVPEMIVPLDDSASFEFPTSSADILGVALFTPKRLLTRTPPPNESGLTLKAPKPATAHLSNVFSTPCASFSLTSPLPCPKEPGDDSLFSEVGSPAKRGPFSPFKPSSTRRRQGDEDSALPSEDVYRPSSPCDRRLGGNSSTLDLFQTPTGGPNHWSKDLPPSSPPPPSSPGATETCRSLPEEDEAHTEYDTIESSPTKVVARILGDLEQYDTIESSPTKVILRIFGDLETPRAPKFKSKSYPGTDTEGEDHLFRQLHDQSLDDIFAGFWSDGTLPGNAIAGSNGSESEGFNFGFDDSDFQVGGTSTPASEGGVLTDLDLDYDELLKWCGGGIAAAGGNVGCSTSSGAAGGLSAQDMDDLLGLTQQGTTAGSDGVSADEQLKVLLGGCLV